MHATKAQTALGILADEVGRRRGLDGPVPTGRDAYMDATGLMLSPDWNNGEPAVIGEGIRLPGVDYWVDVLMDEGVVARLRSAGIFAEPYDNCVVCLYDY